MNWFWKFSIARSEGKKKGEIIYQISMVGFQCVTKNIERWLQKSGASKHKKIITQFCRLNGGSSSSILTYSQVPKDGV
jgi:hypothetical protein